jgi:nitroreductase
MINNIIRRRRSVYPNMYTGEIIPTETIQTLLESANWAPTHKKTEPWRFIVFEKKGRDALADYLLDYYKQKTPQDNWSEMKMNKIHSKPLQASHVIAICMQRDPLESLPEWEEIAAVSCSVQNLWLAATELGLAGYWSSPSSMLNASEFLQLKEGERCLGLFYLGVPKANIPNVSERKPIDQKVRWRSK